MNIVQAAFMNELWKIAGNELGMLPNHVNPSAASLPSVRGLGRAARVGAFIGGTGLASVSGVAALENHQHNLQLGIARSNVSRVKANPSNYNQGQVTFSPKSRQTAFSMNMADGFRAANKNLFKVAK